MLLLPLSALLVSLVAAAAITGEDAAQAKKFAIGDTALVVVTMTPSAAPNAPNPLNANFFVAVDKMAQLTVTGSWNTFGLVPVNVNVAVYWNKSSAVNFTATQSTSLAFTSNNGELSVAFWEAWVGLNQGRPEVMQWQTQCNGAVVNALPANQCASSSCISGFCGLSTTTRCATSANASTASPCDARIYLAWRGPDANNQMCQSYGNLPSNFNLFSTANLINVVSGISTDFVYGIFNSAQTNVIIWGLMMSILLF